MIKLNLIGRDLSRSISSKPVDLRTEDETKLKMAEAVCFSEICYHDWRSKCDFDPDLIVAFNAGIWGYKEWDPTLKHLSSGEMALPMVITVSWCK